MEDRNDEQQEEIEIKIETENEITDNDPVPFADFTSKKELGRIPIKKFLVMAISEAFEVKNSASLSEDDLNRQIVNNQSLFLNLNEKKNKSGRIKSKA